MSLALKVRLNHLNYSHRILYQTVGLQHMLSLGANKADPASLVQIPWVINEEA